MSLRLTEHFTDDLFSRDDAQSVIFPYCRIVVDVERFREDNLEPAASLGFGKFYMKALDGRDLRRPLSHEKCKQLEDLNDRHHERFTEIVAGELSASGKCLIVDCHSFPLENPPWANSEHSVQPDFCIGTDTFHTPEALSEYCLHFLQSEGYSVNVNDPFSGSIVPMEYHGKDRRVSSIMIEIHRPLYMDEATGRIYERYAEVRSVVGRLIGGLNGVHGSL